MPLKNKINALIIILAVAVASLLAGSALAADCTPAAMVPSHCN